MFSKNPGIYLVLAWGIVFSIIVLSLIPGPSIAKFRLQDLLAIDKLGHFLFYGAAAFCFLKYYSISKLISPIWIIGIALLLLGLSLEIIQSMSNQGRQFDGLDLLANGLGIIAGLKLVKLLSSDLIKR